MRQSNFVSIIVPVYNAEHSLPACIDSILTETRVMTEIILVNDGSTDRSGAICDIYAQKHPQIRVVHQKNGGPSSARNTGMAEAAGTYIQFVDADDTITPDMTAQLVEAMTDHTQLVICGYNTAANKHIPSIEGTYGKAEFLQYFGELYKNIILPSPCNKLYRSEVIRENAVAFNPSFSIGEDLLFNLDYLQVCTEISVIRQPLYNYVTGEGSITRSYSPNLYANQQILHQAVKAFLLKENRYTKANKYFLHTIYINSIINCMDNLFYKNSGLTVRQKRNQIADMISDDQLDRQRECFHDSIQGRLIERLIKQQSVNTLHLFFTGKNVVRNQLPALFHILKKMNKG